MDGRYSVGFFSCQRLVAPLAAGAMVGDGRAMRGALVFPLLLLAAAPVQARERIGQYGGWGAFRDESPARCFAIAQPLWRKKHDPSFPDFPAPPGGGPPRNRQDGCGSHPLTALDRQCQSAEGPTT